MIKFEFEFQIPYQAEVEYNDGNAMGTPTLNISSRGFIPKNVTTFR